MNKEKIDDLIRELVVLCNKEKIMGINIRVNVKNEMEYYASFEFKELGIPINKILKKYVKDRTEEEHQKLIKHKFNGNVREYLLSMGKFKDIEINGD